jgi:alcohol oxidase
MTIYVTTCRQLILLSLQMGTCAMKRKEDSGVVDSRLNVYGTRNLKIAGICCLMPQFAITHACCCADCSIAPRNVGANTYNTAIAIGEKAAVLIAEDLRISGV